MGLVELRGQGPGRTGGPGDCLPLPGSMPVWFPVMWCQKAERVGSWWVARGGGNSAYVTIARCTGSSERSLFVFPVAVFGVRCQASPAATIVFGAAVPREASRLPLSVNTASCLDARGGGRHLFISTSPLRKEWVVWGGGDGGEKIPHSCRGGFITFWDHYGQRV
jgi:hypothetical protein